MMSSRSHTPRRVEERETRAVVEETNFTVQMLAEALKRWRLVIAVGMMLAGGAAWLGATVSSPAQRVRALEARVDSGFLASTARQSAALKETSMRQDSMHEEIGVVVRSLQLMDEKVDFVTRLGCGQVQRNDLIRACDRRGVGSGR